jgi:hypothetical protein
LSTGSVLHLVLYWQVSSFCVCSSHNVAEIKVVILCKLWTVVVLENKYTIKIDRSSFLKICATVLFFDWRVNVLTMTLVQDSSKSESTVRKKARKMWPVSNVDEWILLGGTKRPQI